MKRLMWLALNAQQVFCAIWRGSGARPLASTLVRPMVIMPSTLPSPSKTGQPLQVLHGGYVLITNLFGILEHQSLG